MKKVKISTFNQAFTYGISYFSCIFFFFKGVTFETFYPQMAVTKKGIKRRSF